MTTLKELVIDSSVKPKATRLAFGEHLAKLGERDERVVALDADLSKSTRTDIFGTKFPERFFNMGIAEANMIGTAAGLAIAGKIPFAASFGAFLTGRFDQIRMSVSFSGANVRLVGTHAGVGIGEDGHSQMALEDLGLMRSLPNMTVFQPSDEGDTHRFMEWSLSHNGPCYLRLTRQNLPGLRRQNLEFGPGRWDVLQTAKATMGEVVVMSSGGVMPAAIESLDALAKTVPSERLTFVNANWIKPIDERFLNQAMARSPALFVTIEDHYTATGLGGAVAEHLSSRGCPTRLLRIGVDSFGQSGSPEDNYRHYGFTGEAIAARIVESLR